MATATSVWVISLAQPSRAAADPGTAPLLDVSGIQGEQLNVVTANHQGPLSVARFAVASFSTAVDQDTRVLSGDEAAQVGAEARAAQAAARLAHDESVLAAAVTALVHVQARLAGDRAQLRAVAIGMYTGAFTNPQPSGLRQLEAQQDQIIDAAQVQVVAGVVDGHVRADVAAASVAARQRDDAASQVDEARSTRSTAEAAAVAAAARIAKDEGTLAGDRSKLAGADSRLDGQEAALAAALASVAGPPTTPPGQLSLLGGSALSAAQLVGWYDSQGYVDLTSAPIQQLAAWYIQAGSQEGVRGDVAFAQAVLETGGFSSPDAIDLSNFAGIGHCDTCASGWAFPSPYGGALGHVQLLRIFADRGPGPARAPAPVLPNLVPARQMSAGCCATVESLTGVWATDPIYAQQILAIYGQMLSYALSAARAT